MKSVSLFVGGILAGIAIAIVGGYFGLSYWSKIYVPDYVPDWMPDYDERLFESAADLAAARSQYERWIALGDVSLWNVDAGSLEKAELFARELLALTKSYEGDWNYGNAVHKAHLALGRVELRRNNVAASVEHLLQAGATPGSPQLNTFAPNMILAKELLEFGESKAILDYFSLCREFWSMGDAKLSHWEEQVENGETPSFGANLTY